MSSEKMDSSVYRANGTIESTNIRSALIALNPAMPPLSWVELRPGWAIDANGRPDPANQARNLYPFLRAGDVHWLPSRAVLEELRYFYKNGSVHLLQIGAKVHWAVWSESNNPDWWPREIQYSNERHGKVSGELCVAKKNVYTLSDVQRFFATPSAKLSSKSRCDNGNNTNKSSHAELVLTGLTIKSITSAANVIAWTLTTDNI